LRAGEPYIARFKRFDAWARRVLAAEPAIRSDAFLAETLFAPLRDEPGIVGAWAQRSRVADGRWSLHGRPVPEGSWVKVRPNGEERFAIRETLFRRGLSEGSNDSEERVDAVLIRREAPGPNGAIVRVTVAFSR